MKPLKFYQKKFIQKLKEELPQEYLAQIKRNGGQFQLFIQSVMKLGKMMTKCFHLRR
jgi:hypothetical protein